MVAYVDDAVPAYCLALLSKGDRASFNAAEIAAMRDVMVAIKQAWRSRNR